MKKNQKGFTLVLVLALVVVVGAILFLVFKNLGFKSQISTVSMPSPTSAGTDTKDWKTYNNTVYGYTLKYPQGWKVIGVEDSDQKTAGNIDILSEDTCNAKTNLCAGFTINIDENQDKNNYIEHLFTNPPNKISSQITITIAGEEALTFDYFEANLNNYGGLRHFIIIDHKGKEFSMTYSETDAGGNFINDQTLWKDKQIMDQIISSFKFTN